MTLYEYDKIIAEETGLTFCGVDEAGRGPLAGAVYAAAVILPKGCVIDGLNDSKKLTERRREQLYVEIIEKADAYHVATASVEEIDSMNILQASLLAMRRAVGGLIQRPGLALVDGNREPALDIPVRLITGGDAKSACIAAASILAKVERDRFMAGLDRLYPQYGFKKHKGYGTKLHYEMLNLHGASNVHRESFLRKWRAGNAS